MRFANVRKTDLKLSQNVFGVRLHSGLVYIGTFASSFRGIRKVVKPTDNFREKVFLLKHFFEGCKTFENLVFCKMFYFGAF